MCGGKEKEREREYGRRESGVRERLWGVRESGGAEGRESGVRKSGCESEGMG